MVRNPPHHISPLCSTLQIKLSFVPPQVNANKDEVEIMTDGWFKVRFEKINKYFNSTSDQYLMMRVGVCSRFLAEAALIYYKLQLDEDLVTTPSECIRSSYPKLTI